MYTSTNIRSQLWRRDNGEVIEFPNFDLPFRVSGKMTATSWKDSKDVEVSYLIIKRGKTTDVVININTGEGVIKRRYDSGLVADTMKDIYAVSALGFEYTVESFVFQAMDNEI